VIETKTKNIHRRGAEAQGFIFNYACGMAKKHIKSFSLRLCASAVKFL
jgi:uroporphyrinogen-III decarboxylase